MSAEPISGPEGVTPELHVWNVLAGDRAFWLAVAILGLAVAPYAIPVLDADQLQAWGLFYADVPIAIATMLAVVIGIGRVRAPEERRFWHLVALAYGASLVIRMVRVLMPEDAWTVSLEMVDMAFHLLYYGALALAVDASRDHPRDRGRRRLHTLHTAGLGVLAIGLLTYFEAVPWLAAPEEVGPWYPSLFLFGLLDVTLCLAFLRVRQEHENPRWRRILGGMAAVSGLYAFVYIAEAVLHLEGFYAMEISPYWDLMWFLGDFLVVVVARLHLGDRESVSVVSEPAQAHHPARGTLVVGLFTLPLFHMLLYYQGVLDPSLRGVREGVVIIFLACMGSVMLVYFRTLEHERERSGRALRVIEQRYRKAALAKVLLAERSALVLSQRRFLADAGHEIRTPLTVLRGDFEVALLKHRSIAEYESIIRRALNDLRSVSALADDLITLARTDVLERAGVLTSVDLQSLVTEVDSSFRTAAAGAGVTIAVDVEPALCVEADRALLTRALSNLVDNAVKYAASGGSLRINARSTEKGLVEITVGDRGPGIDDDEKGRVFDRFYRGKSRRAGVSGAGLGLSISRAIMERLGGGLDVRAREGGGAAFVLWMPQG